MTVSFDLGIQPYWIVVEIIAKFAGGARMTVYDDLDRSKLEPIFQDPAGAFSYPNPVTFESNGTKGPFYFKQDSDNPKAYFLVFENSQGDELFTVESYVPQSGGGGGGGIVEQNNLNNLIANGTFLLNYGNSLLPVGATEWIVAKGNHQGLNLPDIRFQKNNTAANDQVQINAFPLGATPLTNDITPQFYCSYRCTNAPLGESFKWFLFPITNKVKNLEEVQITVSFWAQSSTVNDIDVILIQNFGDGGAPSPNNIVDVQTFTLTTDWEKYEVTTTVPSVGGKVLGSCGNDYLAIALGMQLGVVNNTDFTNVSVLIGDKSPSTYIYQTPTQLSGAINGYRTGDVRMSLRPLESDWLLMNGGTIGSATSGATQRANLDTFNLYYFLYTNTIDLWAPVSGGRTTVFNDFSANKTITLSSALGRALAGANPLAAPLVTKVVTRSGNNLVMDDTSSFYTGTPVRVASTGTLPAPLNNATTYYISPVNATQVRVATTPDNARDGTLINLTTAGTGVITLMAITTAAPVASYFGEDEHLQTPAEMYRHRHTTQAQFSSGGTEGFTHDFGANDGTFPTNFQGGATPFNITQPSIYLPVYIKL